jgi:hypothetical protein
MSKLSILATVWRSKDDDSISIDVEGTPHPPRPQEVVEHGSYGDFKRCLLALSPAIEFELLEDPGKSSRPSTFDLLNAQAPPSVKIKTGRLLVRTCQSLKIDE